MEKKEKTESQDLLISNIKIIEIDEKEAITIGNELLENTQFFLQIMRNIDNNFMSSDLKIEKAEFNSAMQVSVV